MQTYICIYMIHPDIHIYKILHICTPAQVRRVTALVYPPRQAKDNVPKSAPPPGEARDNSNPCPRQVTGIIME